MIRALLAVVVFCVSAQCFAEDFGIEDDSLTDPPANVQSAIRRDPSYSEYGRCVVTGKQIHLSANSNKTYFAVTTANGCNWGAALGPIWVVALDSNRAKVILTTGGALLHVESHKRNGLRNITVSTGSAGEIADNLFKFNGRRYVRSSFRRYSTGR